MDGSCRQELVDRRLEAASAWSHGKTLDHDYNDKCEACMRDKGAGLTPTQLTFSHNLRQWVVICPALTGFKVRLEIRDEVRFSVRVRFGLGLGYGQGLGTSRTSDSVDGEVHVDGDRAGGGEPPPEAQAAQQAADRVANGADGVADRVGEVSEQGLQERGELQGLGFGVSCKSRIRVSLRVPGTEARSGSL